MSDEQQQRPPEHKGKCLHCLIMDTVEQWVRDNRGALEGVKPDTPGVTAEDLFWVVIAEHAVTAAADCLSRVGDEAAWIAGLLRSAGALPKAASAMRAHRQGKPVTAALDTIGPAAGSA